jgi:hypothetical protein
MTGRSAKYKLGARYSANFDYDGMLKVGMKAKVSDGPARLRKLFDSFEDVNYHTASSPLWDAISLIEAGKPASAKMRQFNRACVREYKRVS